MAASVQHFQEPQTTTPASRHRLERLIAMAAAAMGVGVVYIVGREGTPFWQVLRVAGVVIVVSLTWLTLTQGQRRWRYAPAFTVGCFATAVGVGVEVPHMAKTGLTAMSAAGLLSLVGGLVLIAYGGASAVAAADRWWRPAVLLGCVIVALLVVATLGPAVAATNVPPTALGDRTPADLGLTFETVEFTAFDDVVLSGWYLPSTNGAAVVLMHGAGSTRSAVLDHAAVLNRQGFGVLLFDARGHGRSQGRAMDFGWFGDDDTSGAVTFLQQRADVDDARIGVVGLSMGGEQAIGALGSDPRIRAVIAEGATKRSAADSAWLSDEYGWRGAIQERVEWLTTTFTDILTEADPPLALRDAARAAAPRRLLLIAAGDVPDEVLASRSIQANSPTNVEIWVARGAGHTDGLETHGREWTERVSGFLDEALLVMSGS